MESSNEKLLKLLSETETELDKLKKKLLKL